MWLFLWIALSIAAGVIAGNKGRSFFWFTLLAVVLSPAIGILAALMAKQNVAAQEAAAIASGYSRKCPHCSELIKSEARACKHCGKDVEPATKRTCPHCGYQDMPLDEKHCFMCERRMV
jgi:RNA polymerase subunit RPABC4/transcription elongation factor Spt4